jgi:phosphorylase/glycogen(starch) synthase
MIFAVTDKKNRQHIQEVQDYSVAEQREGEVHYKVSALPERTGMYKIGVRYYAKNSLLPHRQDFPLVKWL